MLAKAVVLALVLVASARACMDYEVCVENINNAANACSDRMESISAESEALSNEINAQMLEAVSKLNGDVEEGPIQCQKYALPKPSISYVESLFEECPSTFVGEPDADVEEKIASFPSDFMDTNTAEERVYYCTYLVPGLNYYKERMRAAINDFKNCDLLQKFDATYREPWELCVLSL